MLPRDPRNRRGTAGAYVLGAVLALFSGSCSRPSPAYRDVLIEDVPHVRQKPDFCGEACAEMYLRKLGKNMDQDYVFDQSGLDPALGRGCHTAELARALERIGFKVGRVWTKVNRARAAPEMESQWHALHADLLKGVPSIVCMRYDERANAPEHFRLILGYEARADEVIYHEPAEGDGAYRRMKRSLFLKLWPLEYGDKSWTLVRIRLEPGRLKEAARQEGFTPADYAQHVVRLKEKVPAEGFTIVLQPPFVVIGDEPPEMVKRRAERTVKWAVDMLKQDYFEKDPDQILDIWLFRDKASYEKHAREIFGERPTTPFGYCSHANRALVMNIATGGGTLVHEIVHAFVTPNFPGCPAWFNEGLASLYEQCRENDGHICGLTNWRLEGLQEAIKAGSVPSFKTLCGTSEHEFYALDSGTNYAQARYLCYYLQEKGLLRKFYRSFGANRKADPSGYATLQEVLGEEDMGAFKKRWEAFVLKLKFP